MFSIKLSKPRLTNSCIPEPNWPIAYGIGSVLQISSTHAMLIANRRVLDHPIIDFEDGADAFVFDTLEGIDAAAAIPLSRNERMKHPKTGADLMMVNHCATGGFVPLGALLEDGTPHPAAGTGYVANLGISHAGDLSEPHLSKKHTHTYCDVFQLRFDGTALSIVGRDRYTEENNPLGYARMRHPLQNAIPDGNDLIAGLSVAPIDTEAGYIPSTHPHASEQFGRNHGSGVCRWRFDGEKWKPIAFTPVTGPDLAGEPTLIRDTDGSLLMAVRGKGADTTPGEVHPEQGIENTYEHFRVYRAPAAEGPWEVAVHVPSIRCATPVVISRTAGGQPYLTANPFDLHPTVDSQGRKVICQRRRRHLSCWPLTPDRRGVQAPSHIIDAHRDLGPPRKFEHPRLHQDNMRCLDHPVGSVCQLADGRLKTLLTFRATDTATNVGGAARAEGDGLYIEELQVEGDGEPRPIWRFT